eukprot:430499-Prymnesium_polylepis.1
MVEEVAKSRHNDSFIRAREIVQLEIEGGAAKPVAGGKPVNIVQNTPTTSSTAERSCTTPLVTPATRPAVSMTTSNVQVELRGARSRSSHRL